MSEPAPSDAAVRPTARDWFWLAVMVLVLFGFLAGAIVTLWDLANGRNRSQVLWLPVGLGCAWWLSFLAWRRTVWGHRVDDGE